MDQVGQTLGRVGLGASWQAQYLGRSARVWGGLPRAWIATRLHEEEKPESVEAAAPGQPATGHAQLVTMWCQTDLSKLLEVPLTPVNTPVMVKVDRPHSFCSSPLVKVPI
jgi:hypothetical protein